MFGLFETAHVTWDPMPPPSPPLHDRTCGVEQIEPRDKFPSTTPSSSTFAHRGCGSAPAICPPTASNWTNLITRGVAVPAGSFGSVLPMESEASMSAVLLEIDKDGKHGTDVDAAIFEVCSEATSGWTRSYGWCALKLR